MPLLKSETCTSVDYWNLPDNRRAELINGVLYDMTPPIRIHQAITVGIYGDLQITIAELPGEL